MKSFVGTSGYAYKPWKGKFYPEDLPDREMLRYYAGRFGTVEINNTFYRMPSTKMLDTWAAQVPESFRFVLKASQRITHFGRLKEESVRDLVGIIFTQASMLGQRLGPVLFQLPPYMKQDVERLGTFLGLLPEGRRVAFEFRHVSWFDEPVYELLRRHDAALCFADGELQEEVPLVPTAGWGYLRLRDGEYDDAALAAWAGRVKAQGWNEAWVFFKHEDEATGPRLAARFMELLG